MALSEKAADAGACSRGSVCEGGRRGRWGRNRLIFNTEDEEGTKGHGVFFKSAVCELYTDLRGASRPSFFLRVKIPFVSVCTGIIWSEEEESFYPTRRQTGFHIARSAHHEVDAIVPAFEIQSQHGRTQTRP